jgi:hypothetical protein
VKTLLFSSAAGLGLFGGLVGGFLIQQARPATPLPPFQRTLAPAAAPGVADPHDASTDDGAMLDGDLRTLLLDTPPGATEPDYFAARDWFTIGDLAEYFRQPDAALARLNADQFRRAVRTGWTLKGTDVEIDLVQFRTTTGAEQFFTDTELPNNSDVTTPTVDGTATGYVGQFSAKGKDGRFEAYGLVRHGDVVEQVFVSRANALPTTDEVMKVTKDQADRL